MSEAKHVAGEEERTWDQNLVNGRGPECHRGARGGRTAHETMAKIAIGGQVTVPFIEGKRSMSTHCTCRDVVSDQAQVRSAENMTVCSDIAYSC